MKRLRYLWAHHPLASIAFVIALLTALFFAGRFVSRVIYWSDPAHSQQPPEGWMTPGYIARSWQVPQAEVIAILGLGDVRALVAKRRPTLEQIAQASGIPVATLIARLEAALPPPSPTPRVDTPQ